MSRPADVLPESSTGQEQAAFVPMQARVDALQGKAWEHYHSTGDIDAAEALANPEPSGAPADSPTATAEPEQSGETEAAPAPAETKEPQEHEPSDPKQRANWRQLRAEKARAEGERDELRRQLAEARKSAPGTQEQPRTASQETASETLKRPEFPDIRKFDTEEKFDAAVRQWQKDDDAYIDAKLAQRFQATESRAKAETETSSYQQREAEARTKYKDFDSVAYRQDTPASLPMLRLLYTRKDGADLLYALGKNQDAAKKITELTDIAGDFKNFAELDAAANRDPKLARELGEKLTLARLELDRIAEGLNKPAVPPLKFKPKQLPKPTGEVAVEANASAVEDELEAAIKSGDQEAFNRIANKRAVAQAKNGGW